MSSPIEIELPASVVWEVFLRFDRGVPTGEVLGGFLRDLRAAGWVIEAPRAVHAAPERRGVAAALLADLAGIGFDEAAGRVAAGRAGVLLRLADAALEHIGARRGRVA